MRPTDLGYRALDANETDTRSAGLAAIVVVLALLVASLFVTRKLQSAVLLEDCLLAGHTHCFDRVPCAKKIQVALPFQGP